MSCRTILSCVLFLAVMMLAGNVAIAEITVEKSPAGAIVKIDGQLFTEYVVDSGKKPILWPVIGPTGKPVTRAYPMATGEGEREDHPHHRSIWFTHGDVNGLSYWHVETTKHREFTKLESSPKAMIVTQNDWLDSKGKTVCQDERVLTFGADADCRWIDYDITITAADAPVTFGDTKEGTMGVRVAATMKVDAKLGGKIINSEGQTDKEAWGKQAAWVDYHGPVDDQVVGIAILNHPTSFRFPSYWHVRTYGLFAANPFGLHDFLKPEQVDGSKTLASGESFTLRYRILLHRGNECEGRVADIYREYAEMEK